CHGHKRAPKRMSREEFSLILDKLKEQTKFIYYHLMGEPLTHPQLPEFLKMANERGYKSIITTNGTLIEKCGNEILSAGVHKVNISLHSFEKGSDEDFKRYLLSLADFANKASEQGVLVVFRLWNKGLDGGKNQSAIEFLKENIFGEWQENEKGFRIRQNAYLEWGNRFEWPDADAEIKGEKFFCYGLKDQFGILADGTVVPCCLDSEGVISLGNIFEQDIEAILNSKRALAMVEGFKCFEASEELCKRCGYAQRFV
ncbi:MAG: SPASM domain-containing protein, partial [Oscillospiraceae bacterium]|nr:SPASM domain-containing protein [Oscillospiraceae bacterium]